MVDQKLTGTVCIEDRELQSEFSVKIYPSGYFYARSESQRDIEQIQLFVRPFTANMLMQPSSKTSDPVIYELKGNHIGHVRFGSDNKEGEWRVWNLEKVIICIEHFADGIAIKFEVSTDHGAYTFQGNIDESTAGTVSPVNYWFKVFLPTDILEKILCGDAEK
ncbi:MAG: hypothetical protein WA154_14485 [Moraxellaceae bacterium]